MPNEEWDEEEERREQAGQIRASLDYLIVEGMVMEIPSKDGDPDKTRYRLKTKKELRRELKAIERGEV